jgi:hypothetical protein
VKREITGRLTFPPPGGKSIATLLRAQGTGTWMAAGGGALALGTAGSLMITRHRRRPSPQGPAWSRGGAFERLRIAEEVDISHSDLRGPAATTCRAEHLADDEGLPSGSSPSQCKIALIDGTAAHRVQAPSAVMVPQAVHSEVGRPQAGSRHRAVTKSAQVTPHIE